MPAPRPAGVPLVSADCLSHCPISAGAGSPLAVPDAVAADRSVGDAADAGWLMTLPSMGRMSRRGPRWRENVLERHDDYEAIKAYLVAERIAHRKTLGTIQQELADRWGIHADRYWIAALSVRLTGIKWRAGTRRRRTCGCAGKPRQCAQCKPRHDHTERRRA